MENIASKSPVAKLGLKTKKHPSPSKIGWIKKGTETLITHQCRINFFIGKSYVDEVLYDVVKMDACHLNLGRPWQYDVDATHRCRDNMYVFFKNGKKIVLGISRRAVYPKLLKWRGSRRFFWITMRTHLTR